MIVNEALALISSGNEREKPRVCRLRLACNTITFRGCVPLDIPEVLGEVVYSQQHLSHAVTPKPHPHPHPGNCAARFRRMLSAAGCNHVYCINFFFPNFFPKMSPYSNGNILTFTWASATTLLFCCNFHPVDLH